MAATSSEISKQEAETRYKKAASAELSKDFDKAFRLYIQAAEQYLHLGRQSADDKLRSFFKGEAAKALERAEKIKIVKQHVKPVAKDEFSEAEQLYVLQKSTLINSGFFPLWDSSEKPSSSSQPPLSAEQIAHAATWRRPTPEQQRIWNDSARDLEPEDIVQHIVSDCSVCGAMVVAIDHHRRFGSKMILSSLYPQCSEGVPTLSSSGQYQFRILYNGAHRRISIDDQLPAYPDGTLMCVSTGKKGYLWPSLIEKAYMKMAGGYDFLGSNSSTDIYALAGWIPEIVDMKSAHFQREKTWERLVKGYTDGSCVATLGTGEHVRRTELPLDLLPTHCYAIVGVNSSSLEDRKLTIFDPWVQNLNGEDSQIDDDLESRSGGKRTIVASIDSIYQLFDGIYFSWNPARFKHTLAFHGLWKRTGKGGGDTSTHFRTQIQLDLAERTSEEEVWILLTRHVRSHRVQDEFIALTAHDESGASSSLGNALSTKGEYTNVPHALVRTKAPPSDELMTLIASYEGGREEVGFTLTVYSNCKASWVRSPQKLLYAKDLEGAFTQKTAGGNHTYPTYYLNPQYHLHVHTRAIISGRGASTGDASRDTKAEILFVISTDRHIPVNLMLAWSQGARMNELSHTDLALSSGPYSYGHAHSTGCIPPGDYTLVLSAFEPRHIGKFDLHVECSDRFDITPILQEGAGMFSKVVRGEWTIKSAGGGPSTGSYASNPMYELQIASASQLSFRLQLAEPSTAISLNLTIFNAPVSISTSAGTGTSLGRHVATSGPYSDVISGVVIDKFTLQPGRYLLVPSTYQPGVQAAFRVIVYSSVSSVQLTPLRR